MRTSGCAEKEINKWVRWWRGPLFVLLTPLCFFDNAGFDTGIPQKKAREGEDS